MRIMRAIKCSMANETCRDTRKVGQARVVELEFQARLGHSCPGRVRAVVDPSLDLARCRPGDATRHLEE